MNQEIFVEDQNEDINNLIKSINSNKTILMAGAGSSIRVGYPSWKELIKTLRDQFYNDLEIEDNDEIDKIADVIKSKVIETNREREYYKYLENIFRPKDVHYRDFHTNLVKISFCGIVTTNYDEVLESAIGAAHGPHYRCNEIDLCSEEYTYRVIEYLRSISQKKVPEYVLHLHGYYRYPERIVLTRDDYRHKYGIIDDNEEEGSIPLGTLHTKVIWSLLTYFTFLFVGFSLEDPFFIKLLDTIKNDFALDFEVMHYAIMPYSDDEEKETISNKLNQKGVKSLFYPVSKDHPEDHGSLDLLISNLLDKLRDLELETETVAGETETVAGETETVAGETETVAGETETVAGETETVAGETETVAGETETVAEQERDTDSISKDLMV